MIRTEALDVEAHPVEGAQSRVVRTVDSAMIVAHWNIGREIVEFVQRGASRAEYGEQAIEEPPAKLRLRVGRGYSIANMACDLSSHVYDRP